MKKILQKSFLSALCLFILQACAFAQVTIGSGTSTQRFPFSYYYGYTRTADIYTASEMNTVTTGGTITTISWYSSIASTTVGPTVIYLKTVGATTAVANATWTATIAGATQVYTGTPTSWVVGWNSIDITDFPITPGQNLEVLVEANFGGSGTGTTTSTSFNYSTGATDCHAYWQQDTSPPDGVTPSGSSLGSIITSKPNVILGGLTPPPVPDCPTLNTPANGATGVALNAPLAWTAAATGGSATGFKVYLGTVNPPTTLVSTVTAPTATYTPSGQAYSTTYYWYVVPTNLTGDAVGCNGTVNSYTTMAVPPPPANDNCATATAFPVIPVNGTCVNLLNQTTVSATASAVTPTGACTSNAGTADDDVWYSFVASAPNMDLAFTYVSGATDIYWHVYSGSCGATMTSLFCSDADAGGSLTGLTVGQTYYIKLYTWGAAVSTVQNICLKATPMTYVSSTTTQVSTATVAAGTANAQILRTVIVVTGANSPMTLTQLNLNTNGSTNAAADLLNAKVYYTGSSTTFSTTTQFGTVSLAPNGAYIVTGSQVLTGGSSNTNNYFFITYDLSCSATPANVVDGEVTSFVLDGVTQTPTVTAPASNRAITALYAPTRTDGNGTTAIVGGAINNTMVNANITGSASCSANVTNVTGTASGTFVAGDVLSAKCYYTTSSTFAIGSAVQFGSTITSPATGASLVFTGSQALASGSGNYFWIVYDISCTAVAANTVNATITSLTVGATPYAISTGTISANAITALYAPSRTDGNGTTAVTPGSINNRMVYANISGSASCPANVTAVGFTVAGTAPASDIASARCYYTTSTTFSTATPFGTAIANPAAGTITFTGTQALAAGTGNYFWLVYDIACGATATNTVNGTAASVTVGATPYAISTGTISANAIAAATSYTTIADGEWNNSATWACGSIPPTNATAVTVATNVTVSNTGNIGGSVTISTGASLTINAGGDLTLGTPGGGNRTLTANGTLTVGGGVLNVNGNVIIASGSTFNQTAGDINIDGNDGTAGGSVAITADLLGFGTNGTNYAAGTLNLAGGTITIVDPHFAGTATSTGGAALAFRAASSTGRVLGTGHTIVFGGTTGTNASTATYGFYADTYVNNSILQLGNVIVNGGTANRTVNVNVISAAGAINIGGNLTINTGCIMSDAVAGTTLGKTFAGNIINNGTLINTQPVFLAMLLASSTTAVASTVPQSISGTGSYQNLAASPTANLASLVVNNSNAAGVTLNVPLSVSGTLTLTTGKVNTTATNLLTVGYNGANIGAISYTAGMINGPIKKWYAAATGSSLLPVGDGTNYKPATINFTTAPTSAGTLTARWSAAAPSFPNAVPLTEGALVVNKVSQQGSWFVDAGDGLAGGAYTGTFTSNGATDVIDRTKLVLVKRPTAGGDWTLEGTHVTTGGSNTAPVLSRTGLTAFSEFAIGGEANIALPISIEYFRGSKQSAGNVLDWKVSSSSTSVLTLERSTDRVNYKAINAQAATISQMVSPFTYTDAVPQPGVNYYRLKVTNADGESKYSNVVALINKEKGFELISLAPNPVQHSTVLSLSSAKPGKMELSVSDATGKVVMKQSVSVIAGNNPITLNFASLAAGTYQITAVNADGDSKSTRFVKF